MPLLKRRSIAALLTPSDSDHNAHRNRESDVKRRPATATASLAPPASAKNARSNSASRLSHEVLRSDVLESSPIQDENNRTKRFSLMKFRNYSESHLAIRAEEDAFGYRQGESDDVPPVPAIPLPGRMEQRHVCEENANDGSWDTVDRKDRPNFRGK
jgi:hypothetical protein